MKRRRSGLFIFSCVLLLICSTWLVFFYFWLGLRDRIVISLDSGIYAEGTEVSVRIFQKGTVYYTADGMAPFENWSNVQKYSGPLILDAEPEGSVYSFRFFCQYEDGGLSEVVERTYLVLGEERRITTDYVVMVQGDDYDLFSDEEGIFVRGYQYYEYREEYPDVDILFNMIPANYFSDKEVGVHTVIFTNQGQEIVSQDSGIKIYGNKTRAKYQKSFRLIARYDYDETNVFSYPFFDQLTSNHTGSEISEFQRLSLHSSGNDNGYAYIRNTLCNELARQAGFQDVQVSRSATVYVNDSYMGVYWIQNTFDDKYFKEKYGSYQGEMVVNEGSLNKAWVNEDKEIWEQESAEAYTEFCSWMVEADINDPKVWQRVTETIDTDNMIQYAALEYYMNNTADWPGNNVKMYRYIAAEGEEYQEGTVFDGRYRYLLFDMDYSFGLKMLGWYGSSADEETLFTLVKDPTKFSRVFSKLMERQECRDAFIIEVLNLRNGVLSEENVNRTLEELNGSRWEELEYMLESIDVPEDFLWESDGDSIEKVEQELEIIRDFAHTRADYVLTEMAMVWDCGSVFQLEAVVPEGLAVCVNGCPVNAENSYYSDIAFQLSLIAETGGVRVTGWYINGVYYEGETAEIIPGEFLSGEQVLHVTPEWEEIQEEELVICAYSTKGSQDWVRLKNVGSMDMHLEDWFVSDDEMEPLKGRLPNIILNPGESITVYGREYEGDIESVSCRVDFAWNGEEQVILAHLTKGIVECRIP